jgi:acyl-CoA synthetase (AMP-forming)/AMP-acid ligase II
MVADERGMRIAPGEVGEVLVKGPTVMKGYLNDPIATNAAIRDGWLRTGDYGTMDQRGFLTLMDRRHDLIISGGTNIYPREVEETLIKHEKIAEVAVIGRPEKEWGERVVAYLVCEDKASLTADSLNNFCLSSMARFKRPREYRLVNSLPKNSYGKVLKTAIRQLDTTLQDNLNELVDLGEISW